MRVLTSAFLVYVAQGRSLFFAGAGESAPLDYLQGSLILCLFLGLFTRWAALFLSFFLIFTAAGLLWDRSFSLAWPLILSGAISLDFAVRGGGRYSLDAWLLETLIGSSSPRPPQPAHSSVEALCKEVGVLPEASDVSNNPGGGLVYPFPASDQLLSEHSSLSPDDPVSYEGPDPAPDIRELFGDDDDKSSRQG